MGASLSEGAGFRDGEASGSSGRVQGEGRGDARRRDTPSCVPSYGVSERNGKLAKCASSYLVGGTVASGVGMGSLFKNKGHGTMVFFS